MMVSEPTTWSIYIDIWVAGGVEAFFHGKGPIYGLSGTFKSTGFKKKFLTENLQKK